MYQIKTVTSSVIISQLSDCCLSYLVTLHRTLHQFFLCLGRCRCDDYRAHRRYALKQAPERIREKVYLFNTFFYGKVRITFFFCFDTRMQVLNHILMPQIAKGKDLDMNLLRRWTKGVDLFEKEFVFIPINIRYSYLHAYPKSILVV